jgi:soluble lytic murein transglycosylase-like protein
MRRFARRAEKRVLLSGVAPAMAAIRFADPPALPLSMPLSEFRPRRMRSALLASVLAAVLTAACSTARAEMDCFTAAAEYQGVNPLILRAIAWQESRDVPDALHRNRNGSIDYGLMQINSIHLPALAQYGISTNKLMEPCASVYIAAWHLRHKMNKYGNSWMAVGAYHSETPSLRDQYAQQIIGILRRWNVLQASR